MHVSGVIRLAIWWSSRLGFGQLCSLIASFARTFLFAKFALPLLSGSFPPLPFGRAEDGRAEQGVLHGVGHAQVERAAVVLPDLQGVRAHPMILVDVAVPYREDLAAERVVLVGGRNGMNDGDSRYCPLGSSVGSPCQPPCSSRKA